MDLSVKTIYSAFFTMISMMLLISCLTFYLVSTRAREVLYATVEEIETNGYNTSVIDDYANRSHTSISVIPVTLSDPDYYKYTVSVSFDHIFSFINFRNHLTYTATTRRVQY